MVVERQQGEAEEVKVGAEGEVDVEEEVPEVKVAVEGVVEEATQPRPPDPGAGISFGGTHSDGAMRLTGECRATVLDDAAASTRRRMAADGASKRSGGSVVVGGSVRMATPVSKSYLQQYSSSSYPHHLLPRLPHQ